MSIEVVLAGGCVLAAVASLVWLAVRARRRRIHRREQWKILLRIANSNNPKARRAAAVMALRLLKQGPTKKRRRPT